MLPARFASIHHAARPKKGARHEANDLREKTHRRRLVVLLRTMGKDLNHESLDSL